MSLAIIDAQPISGRILRTGKSGLQSVAFPRLQTVRFWDGLVQAIDFTRTFVAIWPGRCLIGTQRYT